MPKIITTLTRSSLRPNTSSVLSFLPSPPVATPSGIRTIETEDPRVSIEIEPSRKVKLALHTEELEQPLRDHEEQFHKYDADARIWLNWDGERWVHPIGSSSLGYGFDSDFQGSGGILALSSFFAVTGSIQSIAPEGQHFGINAARIGGTSGNRVNAIPWNSSTHAVKFTGDGSYQWESIVRIPVLSDELGDAYRVQMGMIWFGAGAPPAGDTANTNVLNHTNALLFEYDTATSPNWIAASAASSVQSRVTSSVPVTTDWVRLRIFSDENVRFYVGSSLIATFTLVQSPTVNMHPVWRAYRTVTGSARDVYVDTFRLFGLYDVSR